MLLLMAGTAFSRHAAPNVVKAAIAKAAPKSVIISLPGNPDIPEPSAPAILALGGAIALWRRRAKHGGSQLPG